jgi:hypothetical protein
MARKRDRDEIVDLGAHRARRAHEEREAAGRSMARAEEALFELLREASAQERRGGEQARRRLNAPALKETAELAAVDTGPAAPPTADAPVARVLPFRRVRAA